MVFNNKLHICPNNLPNYKPNLFQLIAHEEMLLIRVLLSNLIEKRAINYHVQMTLVPNHDSDKLKYNAHYKYDRIIQIR